MNQSRVGPEELRGHDAPGDSKVVGIFESASYSFQLVNISGQIGTLFWKFAGGGKTPRPVGRG